MPNNKLLTELYLGLKTGEASPNKTMPLCVGLPTSAKTSWITLSFLMGLVERKSCEKY
jgi:hypothetical protein